MMSSLLVVLLAALIIPLLMARLKIVNVPTSVAEIITGIILGKSLLNVVHPTEILNQLSTLGVIILIFLSGMEIDFSLFKKQPKTANNVKKPISPVLIASLAMGSILIISALCSWLLAKMHLFNNIALGTILFSTIALGIVIAALKEKELLSKPFGQTMLLIAAFGEIIPLMALTLCSTLMGGNVKDLWPILLIFVVAIILLMNFRSFYHLFDKINKSTTQLDIRLAFFLVITLVAVAEHVGAENILGAFLAGIVMKLLQPKEETLDKLTSVGYGFFIPIFFIMTGAKLDLKTLLTDRKALILIPLFLVGLILAKIAVIPILRLRFKMINSIAGMFLATTTITLVIPVLTVGRQLNVITATQSGAFTLAAVLTCIISPILFNRLYVNEKEDIVKKVVHFVGANPVTVPIAQQLSQGLYETQLFTDQAAHYDTYQSRANVSLLPNLTADTINKNHVFNADIVVLGYFNDNKNYQLAQMALEAHVPRIIARFETKNVANHQYDDLAAQGVEIYNTYEANISLLRSLIETPATLNILTDTVDGLFEITVNNRRFTGKEVKNLPLIDQITIVQIYHNGHIILPHGDTQIHLGDHIVFIGPKNIIPQMRQTYEIHN